MRTLDIAVCGSGIGGLAAAIALHERGHRVTMFEKVDVPRPVGSGLMLQPTGQAALAHLGVLDSVLRHGRILHGIAGDTRTGRSIFDIRYADLGSDIFGVGIHRGTLFHILDEERDRRSIPVVTATDIAGSGISSDKRVICSARGDECGSFDLVVDATGLHSTLRKAHARVTLDRPYPYGAVWGVVREPCDWPHPQTLTQCYDRARVMIGLLPIGTLPGATEPLTAFFWSLRTADFSTWRSADFADWQHRVADIWPAAAPFVTQFESSTDLAAATYSDVWLKSPIADRLAFIGDSARAASPQLGQGANLALIDAVVLADCLSEQPTVSESLAAYARTRHAHTRFYGRASRWLTPFFQSDSDGAAAVRDAAFAPLARIPYLRREMVRTLAGLKTGLITHRLPQQFFSANRRAPAPVRSNFLVPALTRSDHPAGSFPMQRVLVIGISGAGKSTFARRLAARTHLPLIHLDREFWQPGWVITERDIWRIKVETLAARDAWIMEGNYDATLDLRLPRADTVIWFDYPRLICLRRALWRSITTYGRVRPDMAAGCPERFDAEFLRFIWDFNAIQRPRTIRRLLDHGWSVAPAVSAATVGNPEKSPVIFRHDGDTRAFLASLPQPPN